MSGSVVTEKVWGELLVRDDFTCLHCNSQENLQPAHYIDRSLGGSDELDNMMLLCSECHRSLHNGYLRVREVNGKFFFKLLRTP